MRLLGTASLALPLALLLATGLSGCDDDADRAAVDGAVAAADDALDGVIHQLADTLVLSRAEGSRSFTICGDQVAPEGVVMNNFVHFDSATELTQEKATAAAVGLLESDGWTVDDPANQVLLRATKGELLLYLEIRATQVQVDLGSECIETSRDVAEEYDDRPQEDLDWAP